VRYHLQQSVGGEDGENIGLVISFGAMFAEAEKAKFVKSTPMQGVDWHPYPGLFMNDL
jgi:hypothetical protein